MSVIIEDEDGWGVSFTSHNPELEDFVQCASYDDAEKLYTHLEAANQRELELLAVIELLNNGLKESLGQYQQDVSDSIDSAISKADGIDFTALREHEAKVLYDGANTLEAESSDEFGPWRLRRMAEERREK